MCPKCRFDTQMKKKKNPDYATDDPNNNIICKIATTVILLIQIPGDKAVTLYT